MRPPTRPLLAALVLGLGSATTAHAQCPDGSPPPCRGAMVTRTAAPALNPKAWIVAPFTNVTRTTDLEWLRDAAVNLMSLDMERWTDLSVVPEKKVADLVRELPGARSGQPLGLKDGLALARRAGAANLVMGDFFKLGTGARLVANVFDVRTGARVRSVTQQAPVVDSLLGAFGPLTRGVLALPAPSDAAVGDVGTGRVDAYQLYLQGMQARNRMQFLEAEELFRKALSLDSTFALAHAGLANVLAWGRVWTGGTSTSDAERLQHALAAERHGTRLPARTRALARAAVSYARRDWPAMCAAADPLVAADSTDVDALFAAMTCRVHDARLLPAGDSAWRFRGDPNDVMRLARASLRADPAFYPAFDMIAAVLLTETRFGCANDRACAGGGPSITGGLLLAGDTIDNVFPRDSVARERRFERFAAQSREGMGRRLALRAVDDWVATAPTSLWAHQARAEVLHLLGRNLEAWQEVHRIPLPANRLTIRPITFALEIAERTGRGAEARAWFDSLRKATAGDSVAYQLHLTWRNIFFGRTAAWRADQREGAQRQAARLTISPALALRLAHARSNTVLGFPPADLAATESAFVFAKAPGCPASCIATELNGMLGYARARLPWLPDSVVRALDPNVRAIVMGDTTAMLRGAAQLEVGGRKAPTITSEGLYRATAMYLAAGDSASALRVLRFFNDSVADREFLARRNGSVTIPTPGLSQLILHGQLAAAMGHDEEAARLLDRFLDLWSDADPEWKPELDRLRAIRAGLRAPARP